jgi:hypothetical protein
MTSDSVSLWLVGYLKFSNSDAISREEKLEIGENFIVEALLALDLVVITFQVLNLWRERSVIKNY